MGRQLQLIPPLAWELPYATGAALEKDKKKKKKKERKKGQTWNMHSASVLPPLWISAATSECAKQTLPRTGALAALALSRLRFAI